MIYYSAFFLAELALLFFASSLRAQPLRIIAALLAIAFCGLRYETGYDYNSYRSFFENLEIYEGVLEPGFHYSIASANSLGISTSTIFFLFALFTHSIAFAFLMRTANNRSMALLIYLLIPGLYLNSFSIVRQSLAVAIFGWAAYRLISGNRKLEFILLGALATSFHLPAIIPTIVAFVIYLGPRGIPSKSASSSVLLASLIASQLPLAQLALGFFGDTKYEFYIEDQTSQGLAKVAGTVVIAAFMVWHSDYFGKDPMRVFFYKLWLVGSVMFNIFMEITPLTRISYYFSILAIPLFVDTAMVYQKLGRLICRSFVAAFFAAGFIAALYNDTLVDDPITMLNYKSILFAP